MNKLNRSAVMKGLGLLLAFVLVSGASVAGTLAWLTAKTETVTNTFTSAALFEDPENDFKLWEHEAVEQPDGSYLLNDTKVKGNEYDILPGVEIPKDPTVEVNGLMENAYLYIKVEGLPMPDGLTATIDTANWEPLAGYDGVYVYKGAEAAVDNVIAATDAAKVSFAANILLENKIKVAATYSGIDAPPLSFTAYMAQATGNGASAEEAWANTFVTP